MSKTTQNVACVADLLYALKGLDPTTPIRELAEDDRDVLIELTWAGSPDRAHLVRIGVDDEEDDDFGY